MQVKLGNMAQIKSRKKTRAEKSKKKKGGGKRPS